MGVFVFFDSGADVCGIFFIFFYFLDDFYAFFLILSHFFSFRRDFFLISWSFPCILSHFCKFYLPTPATFPGRPPLCLLAQVNLVQKPPSLEPRGTPEKKFSEPVIREYQILHFSKFF